jgi:DNA (cytosine-5)-methyltransferase 1
MRVLNLYAGVGGNRQLWTDVEVTAVESEQYIADAYKKLYPNDSVVVADAHQFLLDHYEEFDFIWSSPPCPTHSRLRTSLTRSKPCFPDMELYEEIIFLKHFFKGAWVVENVISYYSPLIQPTVSLDRHYFWSNFPIADFSIERGFNVARTSKEILASAHDILLPAGTKNQRKLLRNAVNPKVGLHVLKEGLK